MKLDFKWLEHLHEEMKETNATIPKKGESRQPKPTKP